MAVFWLGIMVLIQISPLHFKQSKNLSANPTYTERLCFGMFQFCKFLGDFTTMYIVGIL